MTVPKDEDSKPRDRAVIPAEEARRRFNLEPRPETLAKIKRSQEINALAYERLRHQIFV